MHIAFYVHKSIFSAVSRALCCFLCLELSQAGLADVLRGAEWLLSALLGDYVVLFKDLNLFVELLAALHF
jgi:hypothetical protein